MSRRSLDVYSKFLIQHLSSVSMDSKDPVKVRVLAGLLVESVVEDIWNLTSEGVKDSMINKSAKRIWNNYLRKRKGMFLSNKIAAGQAIDEEFALLKMELSRAILSGDSYLHQNQKSERSI